MHHNQRCETGESAARADELSLSGDYGGAATWRRIMAAVAELANTTNVLIDDIRPGLTTAFDGREVSGPLVTPSSPRVEAGNDAGEQPTAAAR